MLKEAREALVESKHIDFKEQFDPGSSRDWVELTKDIVAMANTGGGAIMFGVKNDGSPSDIDVGQLLHVDPAHITDKIAAYTGRQYSDFEMIHDRRQGRSIAVLLIGGTSIPMVFVRAGTYEALDGRPKFAFRKGTVYFRHGAKSEPGESDDLRDVIERELRRNRRALLQNLRKVIEAPTGSSVQLASSQTNEPSPLAIIRVTDDLEAPAVPGADPDRTHPYRLKDVVRIVNEQLRPMGPINAFDLLCVRRVFDVENHRKYFYKPRYSSPHYTDAFIEWLITRCRQNRNFFEETRQRSKLRERKSEENLLEDHRDETGP